MLPLSDARPSAADDDFGSATLAAVEWTADDREDNWLISYADLLSVIFTMVVLLFGRMTVVAATPAAEAPSTEPAAAVAPPAAEPATSLATAPEPELEPIAMPQRIPAPTPELIPFTAVLDSASSDSPPPAVAEPSREDRVADLIEERFRGQIAATRREHGLEITIPEVALFASARAVLQESARPVLAELAATLREGGETRISVEGHTDNVPVQGGQFASNWDLASARANAVARYLLEQGFEPSRLQSVSYADTRPVASNDSETGRAANRRVELQIGFLGEN
jgi:chemotaxis protein MotB